MKRLLIAAVTVVALIATQSGSAAGGPHDFVVGAGDRGTFTGVLVHHFSVSAHEGPAGTFGHYQARSDAGVVFDFDGEVTCLVVVGNRALIGGVIERHALPDLEGNGFLVAFEDNGPPRAGEPLDRISLTELEHPGTPTQAECLALAPLFFTLFRPMLSGNITINDAP